MLKRPVIFLSRRSRNRCNFHEFYPSDNNQSQSRISKNNENAHTFHFEIFNRSFLSLCPAYIKESRTIRGNLREETQSREGGGGNPSVGSSSLGLGVLVVLGARWRQGRDLGVLQLGAVLAFEDWAALGERGGLVGLLRELALGVRLGQRSAVLDELVQLSAVVVGGHAGRSTAERRQVPGLLGLYRGALGRCEAHAGEVWKLKILFFILLHRYVWFFFLEIGASWVKKKYWFLN